MTYKGKEREMFNEPISNIHVSLDIPSNKIMSASHRLFEEYTNIVEDALKETEHKLLFDEEFQEHIKEYVQEAVEKAMRKSIEDVAKEIVDEACYGNYGKMREKVRNVVTSVINQNNYEVL